jgi:TonB family protein
MLDSTLKVSAILALALAVSWLLRWRSAALRHWVLAAACCGALLVPVVELLVPAWDVPFALATPMVRTAGQETMAVDARPAPKTVAPTSSRAVSWISPRRAESRVFGATVLAWVSWLWIAGAAGSFTVLVAGLGRLARLASEAEPVASARWRTTAAAAAREHGVRRRIRLLAGDHPALLVTWGYRRPIVLVPASAASWPDDRVRAVLSHEMAHIQRDDWLILLVAEMLRALYWFNPLVWIACRRLRQESEQACDDAVLRGGVEAPAYASHLLDVARSFGRHRRSWVPAPAMLRSSSLERRIGAMLNPRLNRHPVTRRARLATVVAALVLTAGVAGFQAAAQMFGRISGSVVDATGRTIANGTLVVTSLGNQAKHEVRSDAGGHFDFVGLPYGTYLLEASAAGFAPFREELTVAATPLQRTVLLHVGSLTETITISGPGGAPGWRRPFEEPPARDLTRCVAGPSGGTIEQPVKIRDVTPAYPAALYDAGVEAQLVLDARIGTDGAIRDVRAVSPAHPDFEAAAIEAVRQWRFTQTLLNCVPIEVSMTVHVNFVPRP